MTTEEILKCIKQFEGPWVSDLVRILEERVALEETARQLGAYNPSEVVSVLSGEYSYPLIRIMQLNNVYGCLFRST